MVGGVAAVIVAVPEAGLNVEGSRLLMMLRHRCLSWRRSRKWTLDGK